MNGPLSPQATVGAYRILQLIGRGGMGEVYLAEDLSLGRQVALKALPPRYADDPRRVQRLEAEGRALASLNHPHIGVLHGIERGAGTPLLVMEYVAGESLSAVLDRGPVPVPRALRILIEVAEAVGAAHSSGILHGDLKPANIVIREDGHVKVVDFGLSRPVEPESVTTDDSTVDDRGGSEPTSIRGTPAYMSPETRAGAALTRKSDIWAFGCVAFELLSGHRAFTRTRTSLSWDLLPPETPPELRQLIERCLRFDPLERLCDIGDVRLALVDLASAPPARVPRTTIWRAAVAVGVIGAAAGLGFLMAPDQTSKPAVRRLAVAIPATARGPVISPDGSRVAYVNEGQLWVHELTSGQSRRLGAGADGPARRPFWAPDSRAVGFATPTSLMAASLDGGYRRIAGIPRGPLEGAAWSPLGTIAFAMRNGPLFEVPAAGGEPVVRLPAAPEAYVDAHAPHYLPDGKTLLFGLHQADDNVVLARLEGARLHVLLDRGYEDSDHPVFVPPDLLVFEQAPLRPGIVAVRYTPDQTAITATPVQIASEATMPSVGAGGLLLVQQGDGRERQLAWFDRNGALLERAGPPHVGLTNPAISPDGQRIAVGSQDDDGGVLVLDRTGYTRVATDMTAGHPTWSGDGSLYFHASVPRETSQIWRLSPGESGIGQRVAKGIFPVAGPNSEVWFTRPTNSTQSDIWRWISAGTTTTEQPFRTTSANEYAAYPSPDGRFVAFAVSDNSGDGVYVQPVDARQPPTVIARDGTGWPIWRRDEVFFPWKNELWASTIRTAPTLQIGSPRRLFAFKDVGVAFSTWFFDISPDGRKVLVVQTPHEFSTRALVVESWAALID